MAQMTPLPPEEEPRKPGWVTVLGIASIVLLVGVIAYLAWIWIGGLPGGPSSVLSFLSGKPSAAATTSSDAAVATNEVPETSTEAMTPVASADAAQPPSVTPSPTLAFPTATPTIAASATPLPTEPHITPEATDQSLGEADGTDDMPPTGIGSGYLVAIAMTLAALILIARVLRVKFQA